MPTRERERADGDGGFVKTSTSYFTNYASYNNAVGWDDADSGSYHLFVRFADVNIPQGQQIKHAYLIGKTYSRGGSGPVATHIYGMLELDHVAPNSYSEWSTDHSSYHTAASVAWAIPQVVSAVHQYGSPDIAPIVEEIAGQASWAANNAMGFHIDYDGTDVNENRIYTTVEPYWYGFWYGWSLIVQFEDEYAPIVQNSTKSSGTSSSIDLFYPDDCAAGNLLIGAINQSGAVTHTWPDGWNQIRTKQNGTSLTVSVGWYKCTGSESGSATVTSTGSGAYTTAVERIINASSPTVSPPEASTAASGTDTTPNPDSVSPSNGSGSYLGLAVYGWNSGSSSLSAFPSSDWQYTFDGFHVGTTVPQLAICSSLQEDVSSLEGGTITLTTTAPWAAMTVAIASGTRVAATAITLPVVDITSGLGKWVGPEAICLTTTIPQVMNQQEGWGMLIF